MAKAEDTRNTEYLDASPEDFSEKVQALLKEEREIYEMLKAQKARVLEAVRAELPAMLEAMGKTMPTGREVSGTAFTRWGQWQIVMKDKAQAKTAPPRKSLTAFMADMAANGRRS